MGEMSDIRWGRMMQATRAGIAVLAWTALLLQLYLMVVTGAAGAAAVLERVVNYFSFFTILTNFVVAVGLTVSFLFPGTGWGRFFSSAQVQTATAVYIVIVGATYTLLLRHLWNPVGAQKLADVLLHDVVPIAYGVYWLIFVPKGQLRWKHAVQWLIYPVVYMAYTLAHGALSGWYPYPFVDAAVIGLPKALMNGLMFLLVFFGAGLAAIAFGRWMGAARFGTNS